MGQVAQYIQRTFRGGAVLAGVAAVGGFLALIVAGLGAASQQGVQVYVSVPLTAEEIELLLQGGFVALLGGIVVNTLANAVANFTAGLQGGAQTTQSAAGSSGAVEDSSGGVPVAERYRRRLERLYLGVAGLVVGLVVLTLLGSGTVGVVGRIAELSTVILFGSVGGAVVVAAILGGLWYGVKREATEALVAGFVVAVLFFVSAVLAQAPGLVIFALYLCYYSLRARGATTFQFVEASEVPGTINRHFE